MAEAIKVLRQTDLTQGEETIDFNHADPNEILMMSSTGGSFTGTTSMKATTTAIVTLFEGSLEDYEEVYRAAFRRQGIYRMHEFMAERGKPFEHTPDEQVRLEIRDMLDLVKDMTISTILGFRRKHLFIRVDPA